VNCKKKPVVEGVGWGELADCGRGIPLRMRQIHCLNSRLSSLTSSPSIFYFYFTLLQLILFSIPFALSLSFLLSPS
jgi:hypothetical protein